MDCFYDQPFWSALLPLSRLDRQEKSRGGHRHARPLVVAGQRKSSPTFAGEPCFKALMIFQGFWRFEPVAGRLP
jgi:hypothetical protein